MNRKISILTIGGIAFILSGILFFLQFLFLFPMSSPPLIDRELSVWLENWKFNIAMADEILLFAALSLIPAVVALYQILVKVDQVKTIIGCGLLAVVIPCFIVLDIILGRLVYPVYNIELSLDSYKLVLSSYYGGLHMAAIILCMATIILSFVIRRSVLGKTTAYFGFVVGVTNLIGAYPWVTGGIVYFITQMFFAGWFVLLGVRMLMSYYDRKGTT